VASMLYNTSPRDPIVLVAVAATLAIVAIMASIVPAWRAASTDPAIALRSE
jgi:putative ABC transport system permease protein